MAHRLQGGRLGAAPLGLAVMAGKVGRGRSSSDDSRRADERWDSSWNGSRRWGEVARGATTQGAARGEQIAQAVPGSVGVG